MKKNKVALTGHLSTVKSYLWFFLDEIIHKNPEHPKQIQQPDPTQYNFIFHSISSAGFCVVFFVALSWWPCHSSVNQLCTKRMSPSMDPTSTGSLLEVCNESFQGIQKKHKKKTNKNQLKSHQCNIYIYLNK